jgi:hypothetical protein
VAEPEWLSRWLCRLVALHRVLQVGVVTPRTSVVELQSCPRGVPMSDRGGEGCRDKQRPEKGADTSSGYRGPFSTEATYGVVPG